MAAAYTTEAVVLRSFRTGEADRVVHLLSPERGRLAAIAKGSRRTTAKIGGRLEPLTRLEADLRPGRGELDVLTGAHVLWSGDRLRRDPDLVLAASAGIEAVVRLFPEPEPDPRLFEGLCRYLEALEAVDADAPEARMRADAITVAFVLKLLALAGWRPILDHCPCGAQPTAYDPDAGSGRCASCGGGFIVDTRILRIGTALLASPLDAPIHVDSADLGPLARICRTTAEAHGGVRLALLGRATARA